MWQGINSVPDIPEANILKIKMTDEICTFHRIVLIP